MKRREFIKYALIAPFALSSIGNVLACGGGGSGNVHSSAPFGNSVTTLNSKLPLNVPREDGGLLGYFRPKGRNFTLEASPDSLEIVPGKITTNLLTYKVGNYTNPILVLRRGEQFSCNFVNKTGEESIVHWHGFRAPWRSDGHPYYAVENGESYQYPPFTIIDRSGTYFYHPHPHGRTGYQVYHGLAGMIIIEDEDEDNLKNALDLQYGTTDIPLIIQDKSFDSNGNLVYNPMGMNGKMGFWGDTILVNLTPNPYLNVERRVYRFRILNGSNARPYRLVLLKGEQRVPFYVVGVEGGLLERPVRTDEILVAPGERIDVLVDFRLVNEGDVLKLYSLRHNLVGMGFGRMNSQMMGRGGRRMGRGLGNDGNGMRGGMNGIMGLTDGEFEVMELRVVKNSKYDKRIPGELSEVKRIDTTYAKVQNVTLGMGMGGFTIDGKIWNSYDPLADYGYNYNNGDVVVFRIRNMTGMYHPVHFHGFQFQILRRSSGPLRPTDLGWKDIAIVAPHETVEVALSLIHI